MMRRPVYALLAILFAACGASPAAPTSSAAPPAEAEASFDYEIDEVLPPQTFLSKEGVSLELVHLRKPGSDKRFALARFRGVENPLAGKSVLLERFKENNDKYWKTRFDGRQVPLVWMLEVVGQSGSRIDVLLDLPWVTSRIPVEYDSARSQTMNVDELIALHQSQVKDGSLAKLERIDRDHHIKIATDATERTRSQLLEACGNSFTIETDWESMFAMKRQYRKSCGGIFTTAIRVCKRDPDSRQTLQAKTKKLVCSYGDSTQVTVNEAGEFRVQVGQASIVYEDIYKQMKAALKLTRSVMADESGRILVFDPDSISHTDKNAFLGDDVTLRKLPLRTGYHWLWEPNGTTTELSMTREGLSVKCPQRTYLFKPIAPERRRKILKSASFEGPLWERESFSLSRDDRGNYYYVDRKREAFGGKNYRVFVGKRGQVTVTPLIDIVDDSDGLIFSTKTGKLRLVLKKGKKSAETAHWIDGKKKKPLVVLPLITNRDLIYSELGIYDGERFGTLCE
jgi:hypothetical protein